MTEDGIVLYGTNWCGGSRRARLLLDRHNVAYKWVDIDCDREGEAFVKKVNKGYRSVPTIVWPDGSILVEPSDNELVKKMGIT